MLGLLVWLPLPVAAHGLFDHGLVERLPLWLTGLLMLAAWALYLLGCRRVPPRRADAACFHLALLLAVVAIFGPLDDWAETSAAWHMTQHMLFILVIGPLAAAARPLPQWRSVLGRAGQSLWNPLLRSARHPGALALLHGAVIWVWHVPRLYQLALDNLWWHAIEHACFLLSAWLFWWAVLRAPPRQAPQALLAVLLTLMHTGLLGALLTFAPVSFYGDARSLADQQLAGLLMWVPGGVLYLLGAGWVAWRWLGRAPQTQQSPHGAGFVRAAGDVRTPAPQRPGTSRQ